MQLERARTVEEAASVINRFAGPPLNVIVADERGRIAYTLCGKFPVRNKENTTRVCGKSSAAWIGYIHPDELPRIVESPDGFLVNANNMSVGKEYPNTAGPGLSAQLSCLQNN
jgi:penicillin amidase